MTPPASTSYADSEESQIEVHIARSVQSPDAWLTSPRWPSPNDGYDNGWSDYTFRPRWAPWAALAAQPVVVQQKDGGPLCSKKHWPLRVALSSFDDLELRSRIRVLRPCDEAAVDRWQYSRREGGTESPG